MHNYQKTRRDQLALIKALTNALDSRDKYTYNHSENVAKYSLELAKKMNLPKDQCDFIYTGGLLHDIGKIGIPEHILTKPGRLTKEEFAVIQQHPKIGHETLKHISHFRHTGVLSIILYHHERYDGKGYPNGLKGKEIPLYARIVAVADTFDAMTSRRTYRNELDLNYTLNEISKNKGTQFDPDIAEHFIEMYQDHP